MRAIWKIFKALLNLMGTLIVLLVIGLLFILTEPGRQWLEKTLSEQISRTGHRVELVGLEFGWPLFVQFQNITAYGTNAPWLTIDGLRVGVNSWEPISWTIHCVQADLQDLPPKQQKQSSATTNDTKIILFPLRVDSVCIESLKLSLLEALKTEAFLVQGSFSLAGDLENDHVHLTADNLPSSLMAVQLLALLRSGKVSARFAAANIPVDTFFAKRSESPQGTLDLRVVAAGDWPQPVVTAELFSTNLVPFHWSPPLLLNATGCLDAASATYGLSARVSNVWMQSVGNIPVRWSLIPPRFEIDRERLIAASAEGQADLDAIYRSAHTLDYQFGGIITADFEYSGTITGGLFAGSGRLKNGFYESYKAGSRLQQVNIDAQSAGPEVRLIGSARTAKDGKVSLEGSARIDSSRKDPFKVRMQLDKAVIIRRPSMEIALSGNITATGTPARVNCMGDLRVDPSWINLNNFASPLPPTLKDVPKVEAKKSKRGADHVRGEIRINISDQLVVSGYGLDSRWEGDLNLHSGDSGWDLTGKLRTRRGSLKFMGRPFRILEGELTFMGPLGEKPKIDLEADYQRGENLAFVRLLGGFDSLDLKLRSDPPLPEDEILSRVLFGKNLSTITPFQALQVATASGNIGKKGGALDVMGRTRELLNVDQLDLVEMGEDQGETGLVAGKYLSSGLYVEVQRPFGENGSEVTAECELSPRLSLETSVGNALRSGIGLNWKLDY